MTTKNRIAELKQRAKLAWMILRGRDGNLVQHALRETFGMRRSQDEMDREMARGLIDVVRVFSAQGHSGFSAGYAVSALTPLQSCQGRRTADRRDRAPGSRGDPTLRAVWCRPRCGAWSASREHGGCDGMQVPISRPRLLPEACAMTCSAEEIRWLMEWAAFLIVVVLFAAAGAWRWAADAARAAQGDRNVR